MRIDAAFSVHTRMSAAIALTGASSFASRPLLFALLRRQPSQLVLCDTLDGLAELQPQLLPCCRPTAAPPCAATSWPPSRCWTPCLSPVCPWWSSAATWPPNARAWLDPAWLRERVAEAFIDQLLGSASAQSGQQLIAAEPVVLPRQPLQIWLTSLAEPLARYDNPVVREALEGLWT